MQHSSTPDRTPLQLHAAVTLEPRHKVEFEGSQTIAAVDFSPDGSSCYCLVDGKAIDLWALGVAWWPELLGGLMGLVVLTWLIVAARVRRRPQRRGVPHCRRCNYDVTAQAPESVKPAGERRLPTAGTLCPECGVDLSKRRPRRGRTTVRRLWALTMVMLAAVIGYGSMLALGLPRDGWMAKKTWFSSAWFDATARTKNWAWALKHEKDVTRLMRVDSATGAVSGPLLVSRGFPTEAMKVSPDGSHIAMASGRRILWVDSRSGRVRASIEAGLLTTSPGHRTLVSFDGPAHDPWLYFAAAGETNATSQLIRWRPSTGERVIVVDEPAYLLKYPNGATAPQARRYALVRLPQGLASVSAPDFMATMDAVPVSLRFRATEAEGARVVREVPVSEKFVNLSPLLFLDRINAVVILSSTAGILEFDTQSGEHRVTSSMGFDHPSHDFAADSSGRLLIVPVHSNAMLVRDMVAQRWIFRLQVPAPYIGPKVGISANARWVGAAPFAGNVTQQWPYPHALFLYDLGRDGVPTEME